MDLGIPSVRNILNQIEQAEKCDTLLALLYEKLQILHQNLNYLTEGLDRDNHEKILADIDKCLLEKLIYSMYYWNAIIETVIFQLSIIVSTILTQQWTPIKQ